MTGSARAVRYSVAPRTPLQNLHRHLAASAHASGNQPPHPACHLRPDIGIAYCNRPMPTTPVRKLLEPLRDLPAVSVRLDHVQLVLQRREKRTYRWEGEIVRYEDVYLLCYVRAPEGIVVGLAEQLG